MYATASTFLHQNSTAVDALASWRPLFVRFGNRSRYLSCTGQEQNLGELASVLLAASFLNKTYKEQFTMKPADAYRLKYRASQTIEPSKREST